MDDRQLIEDLLSALEYHTEQGQALTQSSKVAIQAAREYLRKPAQPMHPEIKKMYEDYFDKCFKESSEPVPENFMDALKFDVAMREWVGLTDEEKHEIELKCGITEDDDGYIVSQIFRLIEAKLKEKNT